MYDVPGCSKALTSIALLSPSNCEVCSVMTSTLQMRKRPQATLRVMAQAAGTFPKRVGNRPNSSLLGGSAPHSSYVRTRPRTVHQWIGRTRPAAGLCLTCPHILLSTCSPWLLGKLRERG